jgi:hypothetical protein
MFGNAARMHQTNLKMLAGHLARCTLLLEIVGHL